MFKHLFLLCSIGMFTLGCGDPEPHWGVQHAEVSVEGQSISGFQTWEFYSKRWRRNKSESFHICARVQQVTGVQVDTMPGCRECESVYEISLIELETDCGDELANDYSFAGSTHFGIGPLTPQLEQQNTHEGAEHSWYVSWDGQTLDPLGYAWTEALTGEGSDADTGDFNDGSENVSERLVLWPGYAWQI